MVDQTCEEIVGTSVQAREIRRFVRTASKSASPAMLLGEPGVGKEFIARRIHFDSDRRDEPFLMMDCSLYYERELKREIFGYHKPGADAKNRKGLLEFSSSGVCYLARIEELSPSLQESLLEFLRSHRFRRLGDGHEVESGARLIVSSDKNLEGFVQGGLFHRELYERLSELKLVVSPLRERAEDIEALALTLAGQCKEGASPTGCFKFSQECMEALKAFPWPKNFDELKKEILRLLEIGNAIVSSSDLTYQIATYWMGHQGDPAVRQVVEELDSYIREFKILSRLDEEFGEVLLDFNEWDSDFDPGARDLLGLDF